jgi:hypothetical protein
MHYYEEYNNRNKIESLLVEAVTIIYIPLVRIVEQKYILILQYSVVSIEIIIVKHHQNQNHAELAYTLEMPKEPGEAQRELGIEKETSYIISVINPKIPKSSNLPTTEEPPKYPQEVLDEFDETENFIFRKRYKIH